MVMWAIGELGLEHERLDVGGSFGGNTTPDYLAMNPNGLVPVIRDKGVYLWESAAIVRYLGAAYGPEQFWPRDPLVRASVDKWAEWIKTAFGPVLLTQVFWQLLQKPENRDAKVIAGGAERLAKLAGMIDARLAEADYLGGSDICFADIIVGTLLYRYYTLDFERADAPHLLAYYERLQQRPAYAEHAMVSYESLRAK
jgi:glutathione S-transferase